MSFEKVTENKIRKYLESRRAVVYKIHGGQFQSSISDLLGMYPNPDQDLPAFFISVEVKGPDGHLRAGQIVRINKILRRGGIAFGARSIERVQRVCDNIDNGRKWSDGIGDPITGE